MDVEAAEGMDEVQNEKLESGIHMIYKRKIKKYCTNQNHCPIITYKHSMFMYCIYITPDS